MKLFFKAIAALVLTGAIAINLGCSPNALTATMIEEGNLATVVDCNVADSFVTEPTEIKFVAKKQLPNEFYWKGSVVGNDGLDVKLQLYGKDVNSPTSRFAVQPDGNHWVALMKYRGETDTCWQLDAYGRRPFSTLLVTTAGDVTEVKAGDEFTLFLVKSTSPDTPTVNV